MMNQLRGGAVFRQQAVIHQQQRIGDPLRLRSGTGTKYKILAKYKEDGTIEALAEKYGVAV